ncbi:MAG: hypothetical protein QGF77_06310 [Candidatus Thalassarchaeaceae archaeon]|jgi:uncharacterized coiled-coil DUF342 family protein|nr:hypothetical protein [Candidatus Thalassarchaeaceae archaeon]
MMANSDAEGDPEGDEVKERLQTMEAKMRKLAEQRRSHNESARAHADQRDAVQNQYSELREEIKTILDSQKEVRNKAKVHQARRDAIQEQLRHLFSRSKSSKSGREKSVILQLSEKSAEVEKLEERLVIDGTLTLEVENRMHKKLKLLKSEIKELEPLVQEEMRIKIDIDDLEGSIEQLKLEADDEHKQMVALHDEADKIWDGIKPKFEERDFLKAEGDRLHNLFSKSREYADAVHAQIEELRSQVTEVKNELNALRAERKSWISLHNKSVEESTSTPKDDADLADSLVSKLMGSGALSLGGGAAGTQSPKESKPARRKGRRTTAPRRGNRGRSKKNE